MLYPLYRKLVLVTRYASYRIWCNYQITRCAYNSAFRPNFNFKILSVIGFFILFVYTQYHTRLQSNSSLIRIMGASIHIQVLLCECRNSQINYSYMAHCKAERVVGMLRVKYWLHTTCISPGRCRDPKDIQQSNAKCNVVQILVKRSIYIKTR